MNEETTVERGLVGAVAGQQVSIVNGGAGAVAARHDVSITNGGSGPIAAAGSVSIVNGGAQTIATLGGATLGERSFVAFVLSPKVTVEAGAKVLMSTPQALVAGAAAGALFAMLAWRRR